MEFKKVQLETLHWEAECSDDEGDADFGGEEGLSCDAQGKPQAKNVLKLLTPVSTRWNSMYCLTQRALVLKDPLIKFTNCVRSTFPSEVPPPRKSPDDDSTNAPLWRPSCHKIPITLTSNECCVCVEIPIFQLGHWQCYQELEECLELLKQLSLLLEPSTEATIHNTLDYFLPLYQKSGKSPKSGDPTCEVFNEFIDNFQSKLLTLLDDMEQFFLWAVVVVLDERKIGFDWLKPVWEHNDEWPSVTERYPCLSKLKAELQQNIAEQVIFNLTLCISFPHY